MTMYPVLLLPFVALAMMIFLPLFGGDKNISKKFRSRKRRKIWLGRLAVFMLLLATILTLAWPIHGMSSLVQGVLTTALVMIPAIVFHLLASLHYGSSSNGFSRWSSSDDSEEQWFESEDTRTQPDTASSANTEVKPAMSTAQSARAGSTAIPLSSETPSRRPSTAIPLSSETPSRRPSTAIPLSSETPSRRPSTAIPLSSEMPRRRPSKAIPLSSETPSRRSSAAIPLSAEVPRHQSTNAIPLASETPRDSSASAIRLGQQYEPQRESQSIVLGGDDQSAVRTSPEVQEQLSQVSKLVQSHDIGGGQDLHDDATIPVVDKPIREVSQSVLNQSADVSSSKALSAMSTQQISSLVSSLKEEKGKLQKLVIAQHAVIESERESNVRNRGLARDAIKLMHGARKNQKMAEKMARRERTERQRLELEYKKVSVALNNAMSIISTRQSSPNPI